MPQVSMIRHDPFFDMTWKCTTTAIPPFSMVMESSNYAVPMTGATDDATFIGIAMGEARTTVDSGHEIVVAGRCIVEIGLTSASYEYGAGLKWATATTLVADGSANTIGWFVDVMRSGTTCTKGWVLFDVLHLAIVGKQFDIPTT